MPAYRLATWNISQSKGFAQFLQQQDVVVLQEANPGSRKEITAAGFKFVVSQRSHCGETHIYARRGLMAHPFGDQWPHGTTCALIDDRWLICGVHWPPFKEGNIHRDKCANWVMAKLRDHQYVVIAGDTNMRTGETVSEWDDAFLIAGKPKEHNFTMNGYENKGWWADRPFKWICRYDRIYIRHHEWKLEQFMVDKGNFISDHYCLKAQLQMVEE